jgi:hypothetical protein
MDGMPKEAVYAMVGIGGFMLIFMIFMMRRSFRKAGEARNAAKAGIESLGLQMVRQEGARTRSEGAYKGRPAWLETDGSAIMNMGNAAYGVGLAAHFISPALSDHTRDEMNRKLGRMAKSGMDQAPMQLRFGVTLPAARGNAEIRKEVFPGATALGNGLHVRADGELAAVIARPDVASAVSATQFDVITVDGAQACAIWIPPNKEYQRHMAQGGFTQIADRTLAALAALAS